jgi:hypothetical protein
MYCCYYHWLHYNMIISIMYYIILYLLSLFISMNYYCHWLLPSKSRQEQDRVQLPITDYALAAISCAAVHSRRAGGDATVREGWPEVTEQRWFLTVKIVGIWERYREIIGIMWVSHEKITGKPLEYYGDVMSKLQGYHWNINRFFKLLYILDS